MSEETMEIGAADVATAPGSEPEAKKTVRVVLVRELDDPSRWRLTPHQYESNSDKDALRQFMEDPKSQAYNLAEGDSLVAVPVRNWRPRTYTVEHTPKVTIS